MKTQILLVTLFFSTLMVRAQNVSLSSTSGVAYTGLYNTLKEAFDSINTGYHAGSILIHITGNVTETATAKLDSSGKVAAWGTSSYTDVTIRPLNGSWTISGAITAGNPLIDLNGADSVTFDGAGYVFGDSLALINTTASSTSGTCTIRLINDACRNTLKQLTIKGAPTMSGTTNGGVIYIATAATGGNGNDNNRVSGCTISNSNTTNTSFPYKLLYLNGTTTNANIANSGILIENNYFINFRANGVYSNTGVNALTIAGNHFYHTATLASSSIVFAPIFISNSTTGNGENFYISGNYVGGSEPFCGGARPQITLSAVFQVIYLNCATSATSMITGNRISNLHMITSSSTANHSYIFMNGGKIICSNNQVGSMSDTSDLILQYNSTSQTNYTMIACAGSNTSPVFDTLWIEHNQIGGISHRQASTAGASLRVFDPTGTSGTMFIRYNQVGSPSVSKSIQFNGTGNNMFGILGRNSGTTRHYLVGNEFTNFYNNSTGSNSAVVGIDISNTSSWVIDSNKVQYLMAACPNSNTANTVVTGIRARMTSALDISISGNTVTNLYALHPTIETAVTGIDIGTTPSGSTNIVSGNRVRNLVSVSSARAAIIGMRVAAAPTSVISVYNNEIMLGKDSSGVDITSGHIFSGIQKNRGNINVYHNTVLITGSNTDSSAGSYALYSTDTVGSSAIVNNVFSNERAHYFSGSTQQHYAVFCNNRIISGAMNGLSSINYNLYYAPGIGSMLIGDSVTNYSALSQWQGAATSYDWNSISGYPALNPASQLSGGSGSSITTGNTTLGITYDINNHIRTYFLIGAYDYDVAHPLPVTWASIGAHASRQDAIVTWATASETNNRGFEVERSFDGKRFSFIRFVTGNGNSNKPNTYRLVDENILNDHAVVFYRLKQVDFNGKGSYSKTVSVSRTELGSAASLQAYPNPFNDGLTVVYQSSARTEASVKIFDINGKTILNQNFIAEKGEHPLTLTNVSALDAGVYIIKMIINEQVYLVKVIKTR
jgi:trimeric autotransporter adhesin